MSAVDSFTSSSGPGPGPEVVSPVRRPDGTAVPVLIRAVKMEAQVTVEVAVVVDMTATKLEGVEGRSQPRFSTPTSGVPMVEQDQEQEPVLMRVDTVGANPRPDIRCRMPTPCPTK